MPSTAKQAEMTAFESVGAKPFTREHGRPTRRDYEILKEEACAPASEVEDITYMWSKNLTDNYGLLAISPVLQRTLSPTNQHPTTPAS